MKRRNTAPRKNLISAALMITAVSFIAYGAYRGEMEEIFSKAVRICLECIGIG